MNNFIKYTILLFLFNRCIFPAFSQQNSNAVSLDKKLIQYNIDNWDIDDGLPTNSLTDVCQTEDGYIWISSYHGLIRFDGIRFKVFDKTNTKVLKENGIGAFAIDSKGKLWMTTQNSGLVSYKKGIFAAYGTDKGIEHLLPVIYVDSKDRVWSSAIEGGWFVFDNNEFKFLTHSSSLKDIELQAVFENKNGEIWFCTAGKGLYRYDHDQFTVFTTENGLLSNWIRTIYSDANGLLWIGTDQGVNTYDGKHFNVVSELKDYIVNKINSDHKGNLWFATTNGLFKKNIESQIFEYLSTGNGLINDYINNLLIDNENNIWILYYKAGFSRLNSNKFISYTKEKGLPGTVVNSVCEIEPGQFLIAFDNGYMIIIEDGIFKEYKTKNSLIGDRIRHILKDSKNNLWISTYSGLLKVQPDKKEIWYKKESGFPGKYMRLTFEDSRQNIWVGTRNNGVIRINSDNSYTIFDKSTGLSSNIIMSIDEDKYGNIFIGTSKGGLNMIKIDGTVKHFTDSDGLSGDIVFNTYCDTDNTIWIATNSGLSCFKDNKFLIASNPLLNILPLDILEDNAENFWMSSVSGVLKVNKKCLFDYFSGKSDSCELKLYGKYDGIKQPECNATAMSFKGSDGTLWFPTLDGITMVDPKKIKYNAYIPPVYIEEITIDNTPVLITEKPIKFKYGKKRITFDFTALSFNEPKKVQFKYILEGFENQWSEIESFRSVSYTNLPPGKYTFKVIACNNDGIWNMTGDQVKIIVVPLFYQTSLFYILIAIILIVFVYFIYRIRLNSLRKEHKKLEFVVKDRTREIHNKNKEISVQNEELIKYKDHLEEMIKVRTSDLEIAKSNAEKADKLKTSFLENLSHEIRTPLNAIVGFSTILENDTILSEKAKHNIQIIRAGSHTLTKIVDSIMQASQLQVGDIRLSETEFSVYELMKKVYSDCNAGLSIEKKKNIMFRFFAEGVKNLMITSDREKLFIILYNLIENALKFTEKGLVEFGADVENERTLKFFVKDTGIGISKENIDYIFDKFRKIESDRSVLYRGLGLGLNITKSLITHMNGNISVESEEGKGSCFRFQMNVSKMTVRDYQDMDTNSGNLKIPDLSGKKILIAEDEKLNMIFLESFLQKSGAFIFTSTNGQETLEIFNIYNDIDLILMDIKMPVMDGVEAAKEIRMIFSDHKVKMIAQTAYTGEYQKERILNAGFDDYIEKPIDLYYMMQLIKKHLNIL